ncbi:MAG TPA: MmcQ/YjbR family DNA-binding protein [Candidatus Saccharimonadales bacterium]|nr:MmcQ/YjbR family DNA-binding protein [Candidatus Saccharimonadales bacterium]
MNHKKVEEYILSMPNSKLDYPFGKDVAVYKVFVPEKTSHVHVEGVQGNKEKRANRTKGTVSESRTQMTQESPASTASVSGSGGKQGGAMHGDWKMFALIAEGSDPVRLSLKCDPKLSELLREKYESVMPGYHLNKKHWNTLVLSGQLPWEEIQALILHSYNLVAETGASSPAIG